MPRKARRYQLQQKFWLDALKAEERDLADWCEELRDNRQFTPTVRIGLRLVRSLQAGHTDVLFELFPAIREKLYAQMEAEVLERNQNEALARLERMEALLSSGSGSATGSSGIRSLNVPQLPGPQYDDDEDDDLEVVAAKVDGSAVSQNFLRSLAGINA